MLALLSLVRLPEGEDLSLTPSQADTPSVEISLVDASAFASTAASSPAPRQRKAVENTLAPTDVLLTDPVAATTTSQSSGTAPIEGASGLETSQQPALARDPGLDSASREYRRRLLAHIRVYRQYPDAANLARIGGAVHLLFGLTRNGSVTEVRIVHTSGVPALDDAAVDTVLRAQPLPPIPTGLPDRLTVQLPVSFTPA
ncbi:energy transducer TonB [Caulobacter sp. CCNWLY153]|uniref:energy transducer TonB family protein n=1 Tax=unclassified Caulobacter TaxID=2648921 RepID=UPI002FF3F48E